MRIVILTDACDRHYYFCNKVIEATGQVVGVITGGKNVYLTPLQKFRKKLNGKQIITHIKNKTLNMLFKKYGKAYLNEKKEAEYEFFRGEKNCFFECNSELLIANHSSDSEMVSINDKHYISRIRELSPDLIIVLGTCLVGKHIIESAKYVVNMHTGLSPYYRGGNTNLWPIIEEDFGCFGVTIHLMSLGIDSGRIIFTASPKIELNDNYGKINSKCIVLGTGLMVETIKLIEKGGVNSKEQWIKGKLFLSKHWNNYIAYEYFKKRDKFIKEYCELESKKQLPDVKKVTNGSLV